MLDEHGFGDHGTRAARARRVGRRSPADAEKGRPDRAPHDPSKFATSSKMLTNLEFAHRHKPISVVLKMPVSGRSRVIIVPTTRTPRTRASSSARSGDRTSHEWMGRTVFKIGRGPLPALAA